MLSKLKIKDGVSPVIGVILLVAVAVALVVLTSVIVFNVGTESDSQSPDTSIDFSQTSSGVSVQVVSNNNVEEFLIQFPDGNTQTLSGNIGSSTNLVGPEGQYNVVAIMPDGEEQVILSKTVEGLDYSGVFIVTQDEEEDEVEARLAQEFDNVDDYDLNLEANDEDDENEDILQSSYYQTNYNLLTNNLVNTETTSRSEIIKLIGITTRGEATETIYEDEDDEMIVDMANVGETIKIHEMTNLCPGDELILSESDSDDELASETITVENDCGELRKIARYYNGELTAAELINLWNLNLDYFVFMYDGQPQPELPTDPVPVDDDGITVEFNITNVENDNPISDSTVVLGDKRTSTNDDGIATFENVDPGEDALTSEDITIVDAVAYRSGFKPSDVRSIPLDSNWDIDEETDTHTEDIQLKPYERQSPRQERKTISSDRNSIYNFSDDYSGGGAVISGNGGDGTFTDTISGGGTFYTSGGSTPTTFSSQSPVKEYVQPERIFNVIDIDESLIPEGGEFMVRTSVANYEEESIDETVKIYAVDKTVDNDNINMDEDAIELGSETISLAPDETTVNEQTLQINDIGEYNVYVYLDGLDEYKVAGDLDVFDAEKENTVIDGGTIDPTNANTDDDVTVTITGEDIEYIGDDTAPNDVTVDIFKNGIRVTEGDVTLGDSTSKLEYNETFSNSQYVQFHAGIQQSQDVSILGTSVITESAVGEGYMGAFDAMIEITNDDDECELGIRTSGQFDCEVETDHEPPIEFDATNTNIDFDDLDESDVDAIEFKWVFNSTNSVSHNYTGSELSDFMTSVKNGDPLTDDIFTEDNIFVEDTVHMVEFRADIYIDGDKFGARDALFVNALEDTTDKTQITGSTINENVLDINIFNPTETVTEDVDLEFISKERYEEDKSESERNIQDIEDTYITSTQNVTVRPENSKLITKEFSDEEMIELSTDDELEAGQTIEIWARLSHVEDSADDDFYTTIEITVPEESIDATIEGSIDICEDC